MNIIFPEKFSERMQSKLGQEWLDFVSVHAEPAPTSVRMNPAKAYRREDLEPIPWTEYGHYLPSRPSFTLDPKFHSGAYYVQEASSMFLEQAFRQCTEEKDHLVILDLCAAPGGKSTHLASLMNNESLLVSNEVIRSRVNILSENLQKWGNPNVVVTNNDAADFQGLTGLFDIIVVDAPCSGEGLFRKDPAAMDEWSEDNVALCASRQKRILSDIWPALKENGILIYSTCTYNELENEDNLNWLLSNHTIEFLPLKIPVEWGIEEIKSGDVIGYRLYPHRVTGEGFFLSVVRKKDEQSSINIKKGKSAFANSSKKVAEEINTWISPASDGVLIQRDDIIQWLPRKYAELIYFLSQRLRLNYAGAFIATQKHEKLIPETAVALSTMLQKDRFPMMQLTETEALQYLRKENLVLSSMEKGFALAAFDNIPLGWMNLLPGRINNMYPTEWRIRMK